MRKFPYRFFNNKTKNIEWKQEKKSDQLKS